MKLETKDQKSMQLLSIEEDYALRAIIFLSCQPKGKVNFVSDIADNQRIPVNFLFKILRKLVKKGIVKSFRGPHGGYVLDRDPAQITFLEVIETIDGPLVVNRCLNTAAISRCVLEDSCKMMSAWERIQLNIKEELSALTIADLLKPAQREPRHPAAV
jgi:Rrf2 family transcriptional regulator, iron-sulfur cluster assembly transcription factor